MRLRPRRPPSLSRQLQRPVQRPFPPPPPAACARRGGGGAITCAALCPWSAVLIVFRQLHLRRRPPPRPPPVRQPALAPSHALALATAAAA
eukprot:5082410-Prymnesium_polylepis.1